ncbi:hypothetical protein [Streptomyces thermogriseus]|uniref:HTH cro/C1-type domain-containing protein n=1 Tax=Streptomyces thermogriseus TaxID=75292 RepID=A0ABN1T400_9ACTN
MSANTVFAGVVPGVLSWPTVRCRTLPTRALGETARAGPGFLSQLERGQVNAFTGMLRRIAATLGLTMTGLFDQNSAPGSRVVRRVELDGRAHEPEADDSTEYRSSVPHRVVDNHKAPAEVLWNISPPTSD